MNQIKYKRVLLKVSGELFGKSGSKNFDFGKIEKFVKQIIKICKKTNTELGIVVGAGNLFRGRFVKSSNFNRAVADQIGMLGTVMNALALQEVFKNCGHDAHIMSNIYLPSISEPYSRKKAIAYFEEGKTLIFGGGTGSPFFTTDSAAALKACELSCDIVLKASNVNGIYEKDPKKYKKSKMYKKISYQKALEKNLKIMDKTAFVLCKKEKIPIIVFNIKVKNALEKILLGQKIGSLIC